jgi:hypothetical protein
MGPDSDYISKYKNGERHGLPQGPAVRVRVDYTRRTSTRIAHVSQGASVSE